MTRIALVGTGLIGRAWAISFARAGHAVRLFDENETLAEAAVAFAADMVPLLAAEDLLDGEDPGAVVQRLVTVRSLESALDGADHVQESTPEDLEVKRAIFGRLDRLAPSDAVIASSTSAILPSRFTETLAGRHRCLVVHPINPPYLIPAVEIVPAPWTRPDIVERTRALMAAAGQA